MDIFHYIISLLYVASIGIYYFEHDLQPEVFKSVFHSMWWAVTTLTTVGYGDMVPITAGGKIFTTLIVFIGMSMVAVPTGLFASTLSKTFKEINLFLGLTNSTGSKSSFLRLS